MGVGGGPHARLIGKQAAGHAEAHGFLHRDAGCTTQHCSRVKSRHKNAGDHPRQAAPVAGQNDQAAADVQQRHHRHQFFGHRHNALHPAQKDEPGHQRHRNAHHDFRCAEGVVHGVADGVGLHHIAHEPQRQNERRGEKARQHLAESVRERRPDVIGRATHGLAVFIGGAELLCQNGLGVVGGHAKEGTHPHPEHRTRAAGDNGRGRTRNGAGAHLPRHRCSQCLKAAHALMVGLFAPQGQAAQREFQPLAQLAHLHKPQPNGKIHAGAHQRRQQKIIPKILVEGLNQTQNRIHCSLLRGGRAVLSTDGFFCPALFLFPLFAPPGLPFRFWGHWPGRRNLIMVAWFGPKCQCT